MLNLHSMLATTMMRQATLCFASLIAISSAAALAAPAAPAAEDETETGTEAALQLRIVTTMGGRFTGYVPRSAKFVDQFAGKTKVDPAQFPPDGELRLLGVNGLPGSMGVRFAQLRSIEVTAELPADQVAENDRLMREGKEQLWEKERVRLAKVNEMRSARAQAEAEAEAATAAAAAALPTLTPDQQLWIDRFPPSEGWLPALKQQLYHQTIILNNRAPTDEEREWLDNYDDWKAAYDAWLDIEQKKVANEEKAKQQGTAPPKGDDRSEPSGTAKSGAANIDPDDPTPEEASQLPPPLKPTVKKPVSIGSSVEKPTSISPQADKPAKLKNGTDP